MLHLPPSIGLCLGLRVASSGVAFNPLSLAPIAWFDATAASTLIKTTGPDVLAGVGESVIRWDSKVGSYTLAQATAGNRWTRSATALIPPALPIGMTSALPIDYRAATIVVVSAARTDHTQLPSSLFLSNPSSLGGHLSDRAGANLYGGVRSGGRAILDNDGSFFAIRYDAAYASTHNSIGSSTHAASTAGTDTLSNFLANETTGNAHKMPVRHILIFDRALTDGEIGQLRTWAGMADKATALTVFGDSIAAGYIGSSVMWASLVRDSWDAALCQAAISGLVTSVLLGTAAANLNAGYYEGKTNRCIFLIGSNDLATHVATSTLQTNLATLVANRKSHNAAWQVAVCTILPRSASFSGGQTAGDFETDRQTVNAWITGGGTGADVVIDLAADADYGPQAAASDAAKYPDGIHPAPAGQTRISQIVLAAY